MEAYAVYLIVIHVLLIAAVIAGLLFYAAFRDAESAYVRSWNDVQALRVERDKAVKEQKLTDETLRSVSQSYQESQDEIRQLCEQLNAAQEALEKIGEVASNWNMPF